MKTLCTLAISAIFLFSSCKKDKTESSNDLLPYATQTGANTFGFILNGRVFTPKGYSDPYPNLRVFIDQAGDGTLDIRAYRKENGIIETMSIGSDSIKGAGRYPLTDVSHASIFFANYQAILPPNIARLIPEFLLTGTVI